MTSGYTKIIEDNLDRLYADLPGDLARNLPAAQKDNGFFFEAFGRQCELDRSGIFLDGNEETGVLGILISLYALYANPEAGRLEPFKGFKDFPNSAPYTGAFTSHTERILIAHTKKIEKAQGNIIEKLSGDDGRALVGGDFSFLVRPLPKVSLCYIFYRADEDFPPSATCLFSCNALQFLPIDALADVGEYTSRRILQLIEG